MKTTKQDSCEWRVRMFNRLMYVTLFVTDQDKALEFYAKAFGFEKRADYTGPEGRFLTMGIQGSQEVLLWPGIAGRAGATGSPQISVPGPLIIESDDLRKDFDMLRSLGV